VAEDGGQHAAPRAFDAVGVALTDPAGLHLHAHLARLWRVEVDVFDGQRLAELATHGGFHAQSQ